MTHLLCRESAFRGWQLLCVLLVTFPPSKNFEPYLHAFLSQHTGITQGRIDVLAKHCLKRLAAIAKKGPRGKPPSLAEIETASVRPLFLLVLICRLEERRHRTQHSIRQRSASHSTPFSVSRNAHTRRRECRSYSPSSPTASSPSVGQRPRASSAYQATLTRSPHSKCGSTRAHTRLRASTTHTCQHRCSNSGYASS